MIKYANPWKDEVYGKLKGDKSKAGFKVYFSEAKLLEVDEGYVLYGWFTGYEGVEKAYKPEEGMEAGLCTLPIYKQTYEVREKNKDGKYESVKYEPSSFEKWLCEQIKAGTIPPLEVGKTFGGNITFTADSQLELLPPNFQLDMFKKSAVVELVPATDKVPEYAPKTPQRKGGGGYGSKGITIDEKVDFLKKELSAAVNLKEIPPETSVAGLVCSVVSHYESSEQFLVVYFDLLKAIVASS